MMQNLLITFTVLLKVFKVTYTADGNLLYEYNIYEQSDNVHENIEWKFDPDEYLDVPQIIRRHGYLAESHTIQTSAGYLLEVHRIPSDSKNSDKPPIFLHHGLLGSSADWILSGNKSLAFTLADDGYDVWLGNSRGNIYSRAHVSMSPLSAQFWNFSWHDMAVSDLPDVLYHITNVTDKYGEIIYIGHSMGTTMSYVLSSELPQVAKNIKLIISLAPVAYMTHITSPLRYLAYFVDDIGWVTKYIGLNMFLPSNKALKLLSYECRLTNYTQKICENLVLIIDGFDAKEFNLKILPLVLSHDPAGTSTKTVLHYGQEIKNGGKFQKYDYGKAGNLIQYGNETPPEYNLSNIKRPVYLIYTNGDKLASPIDVKRLSKQLTNLVGVYKVTDDVFGHIDFLFGKYAYNLVYKQVLNIIHNFTIH